MMLGAVVSGGDKQMLWRMTGIGCQETSRRPIWNAVSHLSPTEARAASARMEIIMNRHYPLQETVAAEKIANLFWMQEAFAGRGKDPSAKDFAKFPQDAEAKILSGYSTYMDQLIRCVQMPYASKPKLPETPDPKRGRIPFLHAGDAIADIMLTILCPTVNGLWSSDVTCETRNQLVCVALALQMYRADHGNYPEKLDQLVPMYLTTVPNDLYALKGQLRYRKAGNRYVLWSIGPDGKDDKGAPMVRPKASQASPNPRSPSNQTWTYRGDIVAGVGPWGL
jgi:hypothetical protein